MAGNTLGPRARVQYESDTGVIYNLTTDADLAAASGLPVAVAGTGQAPPRRFRPRGVYVQAVIAGALARKFIPCNADAAFYATASSSNITIDTVSFATTGRRGEQLTF